MKIFLKSRVLIAALFLALVGCGGGGGSSGENVGIDLKSGVAASDAGSTADAGGVDALSTATSVSASMPATAVSQPIVSGLIESKLSVGHEGREINPVKVRDSKLATVPIRIALPDLPLAETRLLKSAPNTFGMPQEVGVARAVLETDTAEKTTAALAWTTSARGGQVAAIRFASNGAQGVRLGLVVRALPFGTHIRFYGDGAETLYEIPGQQILATINRNLVAGDQSGDARTYWSPNLRGAAVTMEIEIPAAVDVSDVDVSVPSLSHLLVDTQKEGSIQKIGGGGTCNLDVPCTTTYNQLSKSVALMEFVSAGSTYVCTGTLLNDRMSTGTPYFLTAKHCIPNQTVASTVATIWFYTAATCGSGAVDPSVRVLTQGAVLLYTSPDALANGLMQGDTAFLRLNEAPPAGALYAGSSAFALASNDSVYGVHHPQGDVQKYSVGTVTGISQCDSLNCFTPASSAPNFVRVNWKQGITESGSSGSGLFTRLNGKDYLVGQLMGGRS